MTMEKKKKKKKRKKKMIRVNFLLFFIFVKSNFLDTEKY
jgi:hypothetical protein